MQSRLWLMLGAAGVLVLGACEGMESIEQVAQEARTVHLLNTSNASGSLASASLAGPIDLSTRNPFFRIRSSA
jgi:hypothetical protein